MKRFLIGVALAFVCAALGILVYALWLVDKLPH